MTYEEFHKEEIRDLEKNIYECAKELRESLEKLADMVHEINEEGEEYTSPLCGVQTEDDINGLKELAQDIEGEFKYNY